ncbi:hypothetical protein Syun_018897 [Stephania yunnanensis]|uniref:Uncharacterized protein n=1 Tax=Stephania yunnanensis TaxID=152371 RepID=A0AAP0ITR7_9MAGN
MNSRNICPTKSGIELCIPKHDFYNVNIQNSHQPLAFRFQNEPDEDMRNVLLDNVELEYGNTNMDTSPIKGWIVIHQEGFTLLKLTRDRHYFCSLISSTSKKT